MKQIRHPNILPALSSFVVNYDICIVTPLMRMGSARDVLDSHFPEGRQIIINKCDFSTAAEINKIAPRICIFIHVCNFSKVCLKTLLHILSGMCYQP